MSRSPHVYVQSDVPHGVTLRDWRRHRVSPPVTRWHRIVGAVFIAACAVLGWRYA